MSEREQIESWCEKVAREHVEKERARNEWERSNNSAWRLRKALRWLQSISRLAEQPAQREKGSCTPQTARLKNR